MAGICRFIYNHKTSVSVTALFYKLSVLKHKAAAQLTSHQLVVFSHSLRTKNSRTPEHSLHPFQDSVTSNVYITSFIASAQINQQTNAQCMVKELICITRT